MTRYDHHPKWSQFLAARLRNPAVRAAYEGARVNAQTESTPESDYDRARHALAELSTPTGFILGDVIARLILDSGIVQPASEETP